MDKKYTVSFKFGGKQFTTKDKENEYYRLEIKNEGNSYKVTIVPKKTIELVEFYSEIP